MPEGALAALCGATVVARVSAQEQGVPCESPGAFVIAIGRARSQTRGFVDGTARGNAADNIAAPEHADTGPDWSVANAHLPLAGRALAESNAPLVSQSASTTYIGIRAPMLKPFFRATVGHQLPE